MKPLLEVAAFICAALPSGSVVGWALGHKKDEPFNWRVLLVWPGWYFNWLGSRNVG